MKKIFTLIAFLTVFICGVSAQDVTIFSSTIADWITSGAQNDSEQKSPLSVVDGTVVWVGGRLNNSSAPNAGTSVEFPNYIRFGSDGQNLQINPSKNFSKGGKMTLTFTANTSGTYLAKVSFVKNDVETAIGDITAAGKAINSVDFNLPETVDGDCTIKVTRSGTTIFIYGVVLKTNEAGPSSDATIKTLTVAGNEVAASESTFSYELPASFEGTMAEVVITPNSDKAIVTVGNAPNTVAGAYTANVAIGTPVTVKITPETGEGDAATYTLSVTKATQKSSDTSLKSVTVDGVEVAANTEDAGKYTLDIPFAYDKPLVIVATPNDELSRVSEITSPTVVAGTPVDVKFTVTAEDKSTKEYTLTITREAASTACVLSNFSINGFVGTIDETAKTIAVKVIKDYDFAQTPVMSVSEKAIAVWNKEAKTVSVTAEDGTTSAIYTVSAASDNIAALDVFPTDLSFAAATYTQPVEWIYGATYNELLKDAADANEVGGYELKKESDNVGIDAGSNLLNIYLAKCGTLTVNVGATGGRYVVGLVDGVECGNVTLTKGNAANLVCTVNKNEPVIVSIRSYKDNSKAASTGGTRVYSLNATAPQGPNNVNSHDSEKAMTIYAADGKVYVSVAAAQVVNIYSVDGRLVKVVELVEGDNVINGLAQGLYLINNHKVVVK